MSNFVGVTPSKGLNYLLTLPTAEILSGKNARAFLVCWLLMKSNKKNILKIWKKSWELFGSYLLNSTAYPAHFHPNWAGLALLFNRQLLNGSQDFFFSLYYFNFYARAFLTLTILSIGTVNQIIFQSMDCKSLIDSCLQINFHSDPRHAMWSNSLPHAGP